MESNSRHLVLSALLLALSATGTTAGSCSDTVPGLDRQTRGVDVSKLDLMPLEVMHSEDGFRGRVVDYTCDEGKTKTVDGTRYSVPDQVSLVDNIPSGSLSTTATKMTSSSETRNALSVNAGVDVDAKKFAFSSSVTYSKTQSSVLKKEKRVHSMAASFSSRQMDLKHSGSLTLGASAQAQVDQLPSTYTEANKAGYEKFIADFGTHYIARGKWGGVMMMYMETSSEYSEKKSEEEVGVEASATFYSTLTVKGGTTTSNTNVDTQFTSSTTKHIRYFGGDWNLMKTDGLSAWQPTISANPWLYSTELRRISDLIRDPSRKAAMEIAVMNYLMMTYLNVECKRVLRTLPSEMQSRSEVTRLMSDIDNLIASRPMSQSAVEALGKRALDTYTQLFLEYDNQHSVYQRGNEYDKVGNFLCPAGKVITGWGGTYQKSYEDRQYRFKCSYLPNALPLANCKQSDWAAAIDAKIDFSCHANGALKGVYSEHNQAAEDRRFKFTCCDIIGATKAPTCQWQADNTYVYWWQENVDFDIQAGVEYFAGALSHHSDWYEDRVWRFEICHF